MKGLVVRQNQEDSYMYDTWMVKAVEDLLTWEVTLQDMEKFEIKALLHY